MKAKKILIWIIAVIFIVGGGFLAWKYAFKDKKSENAGSSGKSSNNSLSSSSGGKLSQAELEKYLLEKRLDLQKYFVFNLKELTKEPLKTSYKTWNNGRITKPTLSKDLTEIARPYTAEWDKNGIVFLDEDYRIKNIGDWSGEELDKKIDAERDYYVIFQKNSEADKIYFWRGNHTSFVRVKIKPVEEHIFESKEKALEILKTDPALAGRV